jgi:TRAP-type C4-dicarboxylate transport system permease small subunit
MEEYGKPVGKITEFEWKKRNAKPTGKVIHLGLKGEDISDKCGKPAGKVIQLRLKGGSIVDECEKSVGKVTQFLDQIAGIAIIAVVLLVVFNIILRIIPGVNPILGTYEYVGFLTVLIIGLAVAHCAFQNCHISVELLMDKFPQKVRTTVDFFIHLLSVIFLAFSSYEIAVYGRTMVQTNVVSPTTKTPFYPFIYVAALGMAVLCVVLFVRMIKLTQRVKTND